MDDRAELPPPGIMLAEMLAERGISAHALALKLRVPSNRISEIIRGRRAITAETALRLGLYFGNGPEFWMMLQADHDLAVVERDLGSTIRREVAVEAA